MATSINYYDKDEPQPSGSLTYRAGQRLPLTTVFEMPVIDDGPSDPEDQNFKAEILRKELRQERAEKQVLETGFLTMKKELQAHTFYLNSLLALEEEWEITSSSSKEEINTLIKKKHIWPNCVREILLGELNEKLNTWMQSQSKRKVLPTELYTKQDLKKLREKGIVAGTLPQNTFLADNKGWENGLRMIELFQSIVERKILASARIGLQDITLSEIESELKRKMSEALRDYPILCAISKKVSLKKIVSQTDCKPKVSQTPKMLIAKTQKGKIKEKFEERSSEQEQKLRGVARSTSLGVARRQAEARPSWNSNPKFTK